MLLDGAGASTGVPLPVCAIPFFVARVEDESRHVEDERESTQWIHCAVVLVPCPLLDRVVRLELCYLFRTPN